MYACVYECKTSVCTVYVRLLGTNNKLTVCMTKVSKETLAASVG